MDDDEFTALDLVSQRGDTIGALARIAEVVDDEVVFSELIETIRTIRSTITSPKAELKVVK